MKQIYDPKLKKFVPAPAKQDTTQITAQYGDDVLRSTVLDLASALGKTGGTVEILTAQLETMTAAKKAAEAKAADAESRCAAMCARADKATEELASERGLRMAAEQRANAKPAAPIQVAAPAVDTSGIVAALRAELGNRGPAQSAPPNFEVVVGERDANNRIKSFVFKSK